MSINSLGYLGIRSDKLKDWADFSVQILGMQRVDRTRRSLAFRMDDRKQRFLISDESDDALVTIGWEVDGTAELERIATRLDNVNVDVQPGSPGLCDRRCVENLIAFKDPEGNQLELFCQPLLDTTPFRPGRPISGFLTQAYGMGHAVLHVREVKKLLPFYRDILEFKISDFGLTPYPMYFFHVNGRHHSFALIGSGRTGFHHFMVEYQNLDDVGQGYDLAQLQKDTVAYTLGRHTNDYMTSFYAHTPSGFFIESGWGGRIIDTGTWESHETFDGPSFWGHERLYLQDEPRKELRDMRLSAAAKGLRTPALIDCPWLYQQLT